MRCLLIHMPEGPNQVIRRDGYLATQIVNRDGRIVSFIQQMTRESKLLMGNETHRTLLSVTSDHCAYYTIFRAKNPSKIEQISYKSIPAQITEISQNA